MVRIGQGLTDESPMPVSGIHYDKKMLDVPADYLDWLSAQPWLAAKYPQVARYIQENRDVIDSELDMDD